LSTKYNLLFFKFFPILFVFVRFKLFFIFYKNLRGVQYFLKKINKKKIFFFKKKFNIRVLSSRRLRHVLKKKVRLHKHSGSKFFFKKFLFKTLLKSRKFLKNFFFNKNRMRQNTLTKKLYTLNKNLSKKSNFVNSTELTVLNILLRSNFFFFKRDAILFLQTKQVFLNNAPVFNKNAVLFVGDCLQIPISVRYYTYIRYFKKYFKKRLAEYKKDSWKFFKKKFLKRRFHIKRKFPRYLDFFFMYKLNIPRFLEIDYLTMTIFLLKKNEYKLNNIFYYKQFNKIFFPLYNWKKIN